MKGRSGESSDTEVDSEDEKPAAPKKAQKPKPKPKEKEKAKDERFGLESCACALTNRISALYIPPPGTRVDFFFFFNFILLLNIVLYLSAFLIKIFTFLFRYLSYLGYNSREKKLNLEIANLTSKRTEKSKVCPSYLHVKIIDH